VFGYDNLEVVGPTGSGPTSSAGSMIRRRPSTDSRARSRSIGLSKESLICQ